MSVFASDRSTEDDRKIGEWDENVDAVAYINLSLSDGQLLQFTNEKNVKHVESDSRQIRRTGRR